MADAVKTHAYTNHFNASTKEAPGSSEMGAQEGPASPSGRSARCHTSALWGAIRWSTDIGSGTAWSSVYADSRAKIKAGAVSGTYPDSRISLLTAKAAAATATTVTTHSVGTCTVPTAKSEPITTTARRTAGARLPSCRRLPLFPRRVPAIVMQPQADRVPRLTWCGGDVPPQSAMGAALPAQASSRWQRPVPNSSRRAYLPPATACWCARTASSCCANFMSASTII